MKQSLLFLAAVNLVAVAILCVWRPSQKVDLPPTKFVEQQPISPTVQHRVFNRFNPMSNSWETVPVNNGPNLDGVRYYTTLHPLPTTGLKQPMPDEINDMHRKLLENAARKGDMRAFDRTLSDWIDGGNPASNPNPASNTPNE
jgi:hypothetical protein